MDAGFILLIIMGIALILSILEFRRLNKPPLGAQGEALRTLTRDALYDAGYSDEEVRRELERFDNKEK